VREGKLRYIERGDLRYGAFSRYPSLAEEAENLEVVAVLPTLHTYEASAIFRPTIAEVLAQVPAGYTDDVVAFQTNCNTEPVFTWPEEERSAMHWGYHLARTTLYKVAE